MELLSGLLNYEQECYDKGYAEGIEAGKRQGHTEGRELGIQTGYQRYLALGVLQARAEAFDGTDPGVSALRRLVDAGQLENDPHVVEDVERRIKLAKNKARVHASAHKLPKVDAHEQRIAYQRGETGAIEDMY